MAWQAAHAVDTAQTFSIAHSECYYESQSAWIMGKHPSDASVAAWSVGTAVLHAGVTQWLIDNDHPTLTRIWGWLSFMHVGATVAHNYQIGVRIGAANKPVDGRN